MAVELYILLLVSLIAPCLAATCSSYTCKLENQKFEDGQCVYADTLTTPTTFYTRACSGSKYCPALLANATCVEPEVVSTGIKWPGEKCSKYSECESTFSTECKSNICLGRIENEQCTDSNYCMPGFYCQIPATSTYGTCVAQIAQGGKGCKTDNDCVNNAACNTTDPEENNICVQYLTIQPHEFIGNCLNGENPICTSQYCFEKSGSYYCSANLTSIETLPQTCDSVGELCQSVADTWFSDSAIAKTVCSCAQNKAGNLYCPLFKGDPLVVSYTAQLFKWITSEAAKKCNTMRRTNSLCIADFSDSSEREKLNYLLLSAAQYQLYTNAEDCVLETYFYAYYKAKDAYENDSGIYLAVAGSLILLA